MTNTLAYYITALEKKFYRTCPWDAAVTGRALEVGIVTLLRDACVAARRRLVFVVVAVGVAVALPAQRNATAVRAFELK